MRNTKPKSLQCLLEELRALSGTVAGITDEPVDWYVTESEVGSDTFDALSTLSEAEKAKRVDAAAKESVKGTLDSLSARTKGLEDFVDLGKMDAVIAGLQKIIVDANALLVSMGVEEVKEREKEKKKPEPEAVPKKKDKKKDRGDREGAQVSKDGRQPKPQERTAAPRSSEPSRGGGEAATSQSGGGEGDSGTRSEGYVLVGDSLITNLDDPFGFGKGFLEEVVSQSGIKGGKR